MQFYIIHEDPYQNAKLLPDYAIKKVNVREGWMILCDCCRAVGIEFEGMTKEYNRYHPNTARFWVDRNTFHRFMSYYNQCLNEYGKRFGYNTKMHLTYSKKYIYFFNRYYDDFFNDVKFPGSKEKQVIQYMLERKSQHLTEEERERLVKI